MSTNEITQQAWSHVELILAKDKSGHGMDHVRRVYDMSMRFAKEVDEPVDLLVVGLTAQLHDVDDYKLVGKDQAEKLSNANKILDKLDVDELTKSRVLENIAKIGYKKALSGARPTRIEGMIVSDADMCDAMGASGVIRCLTYAVSDKGSGVIFDQEVWPIAEMSADNYNNSGTTHGTDSFINHFFEKLLKLKSFMLTYPGDNEATDRHDLMVNFLRAYFREENATDWSKFLEKYVKTKLCK